MSCQDLGAKTPSEPSPAPLPGSDAPEADATASPEGQELPVLCQDPCTACICLAGCGCHGLWGSPVSVLDDGLGVSPAVIHPSWPGPKGGSPSPACPTCAQTCSLPWKYQGTSVTPVSVASAAAWTSQLSFREAGVNTSPAEKATTTDSTAETDSLLWESLGQRVPPPHTFAGPSKLGPGGKLRQPGHFLPLSLLLGVWGKGEEGVEEWVVG